MDQVHEHIEETIFDDGLPCNTLAMLNRLKELIIANETNNISRCRKDKRIHKLMWLINNQFYDTYKIDLDIIWEDLYKNYRETTKC